MSSLSSQPLRRTVAGATSAAVSLLLLTACTSASPSTTATSTSPVSDTITTVAEFDFAAGDAPENVLVDDDGSLTVAMLGSVASKAPRLVAVTSAGVRTPLAEGELGDMFLGIARSDDTVFYNVSSTLPDRTGVWMTEGTDSPQRLAELPEGTIPNGLGLSEDETTLYVADSVGATIWSVPTGGGVATPWSTGDALDLDAGAPVPLGANGLKVHDGAAWVSNISDGTLLRIPIGADGSAGPIEMISDELDGIDDFSFLSNDSDTILAALNGPDEVVALCPDGDIEPVLEGADGLASPTATAVTGTDLYITNAGLVENDEASLLRLTIPAHLCD